MRKNEAALSHKGIQMLIWQDANLNWVYSINGENEVSSQSKELQTALNLAYETIDEKTTFHRNDPIRVSDKILKPKIVVKAKKKVAKKRITGKAQKTN